MTVKIERMKDLFDEEYIEDAKLMFQMLIEDLLLLRYQLHKAHRGYFKAH